MTRLQAYCHARRVPRDQLKPGTLYGIRARNADVGIWREESAMLKRPRRPGFEIRRVNFWTLSIFVEHDWDDEGGTAIPLWEIGPAPDLTGEALLLWLQEQAVRNESRKEAFYETFKWNLRA